MLIRNYEVYGVPPKKGISEETIYAQFRQLCKVDTKEQIGYDVNDDGLCYLNTKRFPAADQFFPNIFEAKDKVGSKWKSVIDEIRDAPINVSTRIIKNDSQYKYAKLVNEACMPSAPMGQIC